MSYYLFQYYKAGKCAIQGIALDMDVDSCSFKRGELPLLEKRLKDSGIDLDTFEEVDGVLYSFEEVDYCEDDWIVIHPTKG
jgi:hypothetical protein